MELYEAMRCAPTSRRFKSDPVPREALLRALDAARFAPSGGNRQGWRVVAVEDAATRARLAELYLPQWRDYIERMGAAPVLAQGADADPRVRRTLGAADEYAQRLAEVPLHLLVGVRLADVLVTDERLARQSIVGGASVYPFVQNLLLALRAEGLGAALTTLLVPEEEEVRRLLGMPPEIALACHIGVGYRVDDWPTRLTRAPVSDFAFLDRWGNAL